MFGYTIGHAGDDLTFDERDSAPFMPKCVVVDPNFDWQASPAARPCRGTSTIIYETHVKGFTKLHPERAGDSCAAPIAGLGAQGGGRLHQDRSASPRSSCCRSTPSSTTSYLLDKGLTNYWGYNTIGFFAPDPRYASDAPTACANSRRWWRASTMPGSR